MLKSQPKELHPRKIQIKNDLNFNVHTRLMEIEFRKTIDYDYEGVIQDYQSEDEDVNAAAIIYDLYTFLVSEEPNEELLFDIFGNFNLTKKIPKRVKFQKYGYTQDIIYSGSPYLYEIIYWSNDLIRVPRCNSIK